MPLPLTTGSDLGVCDVLTDTNAAHTLELFRRHDLGWLLVASYEGATEVRAEPFDAVALDLAGLWVD